MKKIIVFVLMLIATSTFCQQTNPAPTLTKQDYMLKGKHQQIAALSLLGAGIVLGITGSVITAKETVPQVIFPFPAPPPDEKKLNNGMGLMTVGFVAVLTSIPFFIASSKNKKKAMSMSFINQPLPQLHGNSLVYHAIPSLKLKISL